MLARLWNRGRTVEPRVPDGLTVYAIGDVHGRADLLGALHERIAADAAAGDRLVVYLGDYVDRGSSSREVVDMLLQPPVAGSRRVLLRGNHEQAMLDFRTDWRVALDWLNFGGRETLQSYGVRVPFAPDETSLCEMQAAMLAAVPTTHWTFLEGLALQQVVGDYLFVHAGIRPGVPLDQQSPHDLLWIRDTFLQARDDHGKMVVHGHSISPSVETRRNRIGIDTGACFTGTLTCLVLHGAERRLIQT